MKNAAAREALRRAKAAAAAGAPFATFEAHIDRAVAALAGDSDWLAVVVAEFGHDCMAHVMESFRGAEQELRGSALARAPAIELPDHFPEEHESPVEAEVKAPSRVAELDLVAAAAGVPAIELPEHFPDEYDLPVDLDAKSLDEGGAPTLEHLESQAADQSSVDAEARPPELLRGGNEPDHETLQSIDQGAAAAGIRLSEEERRIAGRMVHRLRMHADRGPPRAVRAQHLLVRAHSMRRANRARAPRHAAQHAAVAPARDGPPPSEPPRPATSDALAVAAGGFT